MNKINFALALALTCTVVGSVRLSGADGGGGRKARSRVLRVALVATADETEAALTRLKTCLYQGG